MLLHGGEVIALGDAGRQGVAKREENQHSAVTWHIALRPGKRKALPKNELGSLCEQLEGTKASTRAKVEHPSHVVKNLLGHRNTRYRALVKNIAHLFSLFGLANALMARRRLRACDAQGAS